MLRTHIPVISLGLLICLQLNMYLRALLDWKLHEQTLMDEGKIERTAVSLKLYTILI